jgi:RimJ/RimL family protein N-acetyltransferase
MQGTAVRLSHADYPALSRLLDRDPVHTVFLRSELRMNLGAGEWWGVVDGRGLCAAALAGPLTVPWLPDPSAAPLLAAALAQGPLPRMLVGPRPSVLALRDALPGPPPAQVRDPQPVLLLARDDAERLEVTPAAAVRRATRADLEPLIVAAAAMHREEMGLDPLRLDAQAWRARMTSLVDRGWSWIWTDAQGEIVFKAELSAWTPDCAQIQGVYVAPRHRRRGSGSAGMAAVVAALLAEVERCSLYVNSYNVAALRLYRRLGFRHHGDFATVLY